MTPIPVPIKTACCAWTEIANRLYLAAHTAGRLYLYLSEHTVLYLFLYWAVHTAPQLARKHKHCHNLKNSGGGSAEWTSYVNMQGLVHLSINCFMTSKKKVDD